MQIGYEEDEPPPSAVAAARAQEAVRWPTALAAA
jgi:hypothetical protein